jgi:glyoxylase-like metal-dependent hydrolase (beta-lactamase superfamily II)
MAQGSVIDLGAGTYLFSWPYGNYLSPFHVSGDGVLAVDPIDRVAAADYRHAVAAVTTAPILEVLYSHDHRDHIVGADVLAPEAEIAARPHVSSRIERRHDQDIPPPTRILEPSGPIEPWGVAFHDFGPCHSGSNTALVLPTAQGPLLVYVDVVEPGVVPYRDLPDSDIRGWLDVLDQASRLEVTRVMGGHTPPEPAHWIEQTRRYLLEMIESASTAFDQVGGQRALPGEDGVTMTERVRGEVCRQVIDRLRPRYGGWRGFEAWAPRTADRMLSYVIIGN